MTVDSVAFPLFTKSQSRTTGMEYLPNRTWEGKKIIITRTQKEKEKKGQIAEGVRKQPEGLHMNATLICTSSQPRSNNVAFFKMALNNLECV